MSRQKVAQEKDKQDALAHYSSLFLHPENEIYLDGNSLGKLPLESKKVIQSVVDNQWGNNLIRSWNDHWLALPKRIATKLEKLLGADKDEVIIGESTSVNLFKIIHGLMHSKCYPKQLLTDSLNFPTDNYILEGLSKNNDYPPLVCIQYPNDLRANIEDIKNTLKQQPGILCLSLVTYKSAYCYPMLELNTCAKENKSIILWDFSHAVGVVDIDVKKTKTLAAIGCTYKYLNGGPGSPAFIFLDKSLQPKVTSPIQGWFGHENPFDFSDEYKPAEGLQKFKAGTPTILSLAAMEPGIDITLSAGIKAIRSKSEELTEFLLQEIKMELFPLGYKIESPEKKIERGSHITISHKESWRICKCLLNGKINGPKVIPDFRPDKYLRLGIAPLYTSFEKLYFTVNRLKEIVIDKEFEQFEKDKPVVT